MWDEVKHLPCLLQANSYIVFECNPVYQRKRLLLTLLYCSKLSFDEVTRKDIFLIDESYSEEIFAIFISLLLFLN